MKILFLFLGMALLPSTAFPAEGPVIQKTLEQGGQDFEVTLEKESGKVEVVRVKGDSWTIPPHLKLKVNRESDRPFEVQLRAHPTEEHPIRYIGQAEEWKGSRMSFELVFSFDKKTWKRLGKKFQ